MREYEATVAIYNLELEQEIFSGDIRFVPLSGNAEIVERAKLTQQSLCTAHAIVRLRYNFDLRDRLQVEGWQQIREEVRKEVDERLEYPLLLLSLATQAVVYRWERKIIDLDSEEEIKELSLGEVPGWPVIHPRPRFGSMSIISQPRLQDFLNHAARNLVKEEFRRDTGIETALRWYLDALGAIDPIEMRLAKLIIALEILANCHAKTRSNTKVFPEKGLETTKGSWITYEVFIDRLTRCIETEFSFAKKEDSEEIRRAIKKLDNTKGLPEKCLDLFRDYTIQLSRFSLGVKDIRLYRDIRVDLFHRGRIQTSRRKIDPRELPNIAGKLRMLLTQLILNILDCKNFVQLSWGGKWPKELPGWTYVF